MRDLVGPQAGYVSVAKADRALRRHQPHDRLAGGGAADAVAAEQAHDLAVIDIDVDAMQDVALAVIRVEVFDFEDHAARLPR